ncbi:hypothetical protein GS495_12515 [Rhodococcus hoagii]|nr:hypothetical protein [Prescottella equi]
MEKQATVFHYGTKLSAEFVSLLLECTSPILGVWAITFKIPRPRNPGALKGSKNIGTYTWLRVLNQPHCTRLLKQGAELDIDGLCNLLCPFILQLEPGHCAFGIPQLSTLAGLVRCNSAEEVRDRVT